MPAVRRLGPRGLLRLHADDQQECSREQSGDRRIDDVRAGEIDEAADRRPGNRRDLPGARVHRDGAREQRRRHEVRHDRLPRRHRERARDTEHDHDAEHRPGNLEPGEREGEQRERAKKLERDAQREDPSAVVPVGDVACRQHQQHERQELRETDQAEVERIAGDRVDLPADGDRLHLHRDRCEQARRQEAREVRILEQPAKWRAPTFQEWHAAAVSVRRAAATCAGAVPPHPTGAGRRP